MRDIFEKNVERKYFEREDLEREREDLEREREGLQKVSCESTGECLLSHFEKVLERTQGITSITCLFVSAVYSLLVIHSHIIAHSTTNSMKNKGRSLVVQGS